MTKIAIFSFIFAIVATSCNQKQKVVDTSENSAKEEQEILERGDSVYKETIAYYEGSDVVRIRFMGYVYLKNKKRVVVRHGEQASYSRNGKLQATTPYVMGRKHGIQTTYYEDGKTKYIERSYKDGYLDGLVVKYYRSGRLKAKTPFRHDLLGTGTQDFMDDEANTKVVMPTLKIWALDERKSKGTYTVFAKVLTSYNQTLQSVTFYKGEALEINGEKYLHPKMQELESSNGLASITYYDQSEGLLEYVNISASFTTHRDSKTFLTSVHNINHPGFQ